MDTEPDGQIDDRTFFKAAPTWERALLDDYRAALGSYGVDSNYIQNLSENYEFDDFNRGATQSPEELTRKAMKAEKFVHKIQLEELEMELEECSEVDRKEEIAKEISLLKTKLNLLSQQTSKGNYKKKAL